jgi:hypothetical protein
MDPSSVRQLRVVGPYLNKRTILTLMSEYLSSPRRVVVPPSDSSCPVVEMFDDKGQRMGQDHAVRNIDVPFLCHRDQRRALEYFSLFLDAEGGRGEACQRLDSLMRNYFLEQSRDFHLVPYAENAFIIPCTSREQHSEELVSNKGATLLQLSRQGYPVPDFIILNSAFYHLHENQRLQALQQAVAFLERLTFQEYGASDFPLLIALRCAMPGYMPGVMPTYLNIGVTEKLVPTLTVRYGRDAAHKILMNTLRNILKLVDRDSHKELFSSPLGPQPPAPALLEKALDKVRRCAPRLVEDPLEQLALFVRESLRYFDNNRDLMLTMSKGEDHFPSIILQKMICTVRSPDSRVGVLYSRHPRTGQGKQIESGRNMFGEEIMSGTVDAEKTVFEKGEEIRADFPSTFHFLPSLLRLEAEFRSPVTIEFVTDATDRYEFLALLQLNPSEMTGRCAFISVMDLYHKGIISRERVSELIKPYHIKQIESDAIDPDSFKELALFSRAASVLPRSAVTAKIYFSAEAALQNRKAGGKVCLCKKSFEPSDTVVMSEVNAIVSLTSAAIHVITICQSYGLPTLLNLEAHGAKLSLGGRLANEDGLELREGDWITVSSRNRCLYKGRAQFKPARLIRYMRGEAVNLEPEEEETFAQMAQAYRGYQKLVAGLNLDQIRSLTDIIRLVILEFRGESHKAQSLVNRWFDQNTDLYLDGVLSSDMGDHLNQHTVFNLLTLERKIRFFKLAVERCLHEKKAGYAAGAFMLGRFICLPQPVRFWRSFTPTQTAALLNEWLLFEKYLQILNEVGEQKIRQAKRKILQEGLSTLPLEAAKLKVLLPLKLGRFPVDEVKRAILPWFDGQTQKVVDLLRLPYSAYCDFNNPGSVRELEKLCKEAGLPLPAPEAV